jgi:HNH endonuclease
MARSIPCASCNAWHENRGPFCGDYCKAVAEFVRNSRKWIREPARQSDPQHLYALQVRLAMLNSAHLGRGSVYDEKARRLSPAQKAAIRERDGDTCVLCGQPGAEIDHIEGSSDDPANLQLLCRDCHHAKTGESIKPITGAADRSALAAFHAELGRRVDAPEPLRACDNEQAWSTAWRRWPDLPPGALAYDGRLAEPRFAYMVRAMATASAD